jgi:hypothetical protein
MLYQSTSVGFGYGLFCRRCFLEDGHSRPNPIRDDTLTPSSRPGRLGNINPIPIGYGSRPRLRGPANPARINLAQEPLDFRREGFSPSLTLLMSAFALPIPPACLTARLHRPTERSATACLPVARTAHPQLRCVALAPLHFRRGTTCLDQ